MDKAYNPSHTEPRWRTFWEEGNFFQADPSSDKPPYTIVMPPPNVTGVLHMGHALVSTLQDILIRFKRMQGYEALWVPGTDHAGIATQTVVERHLMESEGRRRDSYPREEFVEHVWAWKEQRENVILEQLKRMGCSCDWSRLRFTMDEGCNIAVREMFVRLFKKGLIYQGDYLVNWDPLTQTALADDEVEYEERNSHLWTIKYPLPDVSGYIHIATTRPETMLGDTAIAVSPKDGRYTHLIGQKVRVPFVDRLIPIIADRHVDPAFGTGVVKITPAHDPNDYKMGIDHNLPMINIFTPAGFINENGGAFEGLSREEARERVVHELKELGLLEKVEPHTHRVGVSYRSKAVIEPYLSKQWFVKMEPFKERLLAAMDQVQIKPELWKNTYRHWIENLRDWCISRQLWWGHQIPVWYRGDEIWCEVEDPPHGKGWERDPDVLDTWFSSALWPFSTLGWPTKTAELEKFYPNSVLVTGHDILFFWVARMLFMGEEAMGAFPFPVTFLHGLIYGKSYWREHKEGGITYVSGEERKSYDLGKPTPKGVHSKWEKLSKSKGNVIDPLEMIDEYGTDAVRMSLCASAGQSAQIDLDRRRFEEYKNFANKVWNGARFVIMNIEDLTAADLTAGLGTLALEDRWILSAMNRIHKETVAALDAYAFDMAATKAYDFFWRQFCAYYVEIAKPVLFGKVGTEEERKTKQRVLLIVLTSMVRLLHPMAPFITEELFHTIKKSLPNLKPVDNDPYLAECVEALLSPTCAIAPYPQVIREEDIHPQIEEEFSLYEEVIYQVRTIRGEMKIPPQIKTKLYIEGSSTFKSEIVLSLVNLESIELVEEAPSFPFAATGAAHGLKLIIPLPKELAQKEVARLEKESLKLSSTIENLKKLLSNPDFLEKAKPELIEAKREGLIRAEKELSHLNEKLN